MPYTQQHKHETRKRIVQSARRLFNRHGFQDVSIDQIMAAAGLTRGGFYNHFGNKQELYTEILLDYSKERAADMPCSAQASPDIARKIIAMYISHEHVEHIEEQCPLAALPSDIARAGADTRAAYQSVLENLVEIFSSNIADDNEFTSRERGLALAATCVGAVVLARTVANRKFADEICSAAKAVASRQIV